MTTVLFTIGATVAAVLLGLLVLTLLVRPLRIWPTPGSGSWQGHVFWPLFRSLNVFCRALTSAELGWEAVGRGAVSAPARRPKVNGQTAAARKSKARQGASNQRAAK